MAERWFVHCDANSFYASCEAIFEPRLWTVPLVVLSHNDSAVVALNPSARKLGIRRGQPFFELQSLRESDGLVVRSSNFEYYGDISRRLSVCLRQFAPAGVEEYSIDEMFLVVEGLSLAQLTDQLCLIRRTVQRWLNLPVSLGAGRTKTLAKAATWVAKKLLQEQGFFVLGNAQTEEEILGKLPISQVWGIGPKWAKVLSEEAKVETALHLRNLPDLWVRKRLSVVGLRTLLELRGMSCLPLSLAPPARQSLVVSRSFGRPVASLLHLQEAVATFTAKAARKLRREHLAAGVVSVFAHSSPHRDNYYSNSATARLFSESNHTPTLLKSVLPLAQSVWRAQVHFAKAGVMCLGLCDEGNIQLNLFEQMDWWDTRSHRLMETVDVLNCKHGQDTVRFAAMGTEQPWQGKSQHRSPRWTTRWTELPVAAATQNCLLFSDAERGEDGAPQQCG